jgi:hypothetical protein
MNISYILYFNSNGRKHVRPSNIKLSRQITMLKNVQITTAKTQFSTFPITHKHDESENLAPLTYNIYICISFCLQPLESSSSNYLILPQCNIFSKKHIGKLCDMQCLCQGRLLRPRDRTDGHGWVGIPSRTNLTDASWHA